MSVRAYKATYQQDLVEYDGPQLILLKSDRNRPMLGVAIARENMEHPFFACEVKDAPYHKYTSGKADLRYVFQRSLGNIYYFLDLNDLNKGGLVELERAKSVDVTNEQYWPSHGFFSYSQNIPLENSSVVETALQVFQIDGKWEAEDFSRFHGKMADLYSIFAMIARLKISNFAPEQAYVKDAIQKRLWQGGGSYGGFYSGLLSRSQTLGLSPLQVSKIKYASPGIIELSGDKAALKETTDVIGIFESRVKEISGAYSFVYGVLNKEKLLSAGPDSEFSSKAIEDIVNLRTRALAQLLGLEEVDTLATACGANTLVFAKIVLSIGRRAKELYLFNAEGRVRADEHVDSTNALTS